METISRAIVGTTIATLALAGQATAASLYSVTDLGKIDHSFSFNHKIFVIL